MSIHGHETPSMNVLAYAVMVLWATAIVLSTLHDTGVI